MFKKKINNKNHHTIDVIIPVYNDQNFILQAIQSIEQQTFQPTKIIIVNDGSTDNTEKIILNYKKKLPIKYIKKENGGLSSARNTGIKLATSEFVAFLDSDDIWYKEKLKEQIKKFNKNEFDNLGLVYCEYILIDKYNNKIEDTDVSRHINQKIRGKVFKKILETNKISSSGSGVLIKNKYLKQARFFDEKLKAGEDHDMWLRLAECCEFDYTNKVLVGIRKHGQNMQKNNHHIFFNKIIFYNKWVEILDKKNITIPDFWKQNITGKSLRRLPRTDFLKLIKKTLSKKAKNKMFPFGFFELYIIIFLLNKIIIFPKKIVNNKNIIKITT